MKRKVACISPFWQYRADLRGIQYAAIIQRILRLRLRIQIAHRSGDLRIGADGKSAGLEACGGMSVDGSRHRQGLLPMDTSPMDTSQTLAQTLVKGCIGSSEFGEAAK